MRNAKQATNISASEGKLAVGLQSEEETSSLKIHLLLYFIYNTNNCTAFPWHQVKAKPSKTISLSDLRGAIEDL